MNGPSPDVRAMWKAADGTVDRAFVINCFAAESAGASCSRGLRGDHDLNPGMGLPARQTPCAVLVPIIDHAGQLSVLFTQRTDHLANHPGQISFPGGRCEPGDATLEDAALREAKEEIGLERETATVLGRLDDYVTRTGFRVTPVVALIRPPLVLTPDANEVAGVFEVPLEFLMNPANHRRFSRRFQDVERAFYAVPFVKHYIWGATAGMIVNLHDRLTQR
jgi:8-oxo-dGTP pyrophosphatase MutT (NUDIX family)